MQTGREKGMCSGRNPGSWEPAARVLIVTAVEAERNAVLRGLRGDARFEVVAGGVGPAASAAAAAAALAGGEYGLVVSAGIGGGFAGRAAPGTVVVADSIVAADLGVETPEGFLSVDELGFGSARAAVDTGLAVRVADALRAAGLGVTLGPVVTVSTATGTAETAAAMAARVPNAAAEAMEGYGAAVAARVLALPVLEIRAISNAVGPRNRASWRIEEALSALEQASCILSEALL